MIRLWTMEGKGWDLSAHLAELTGFAEAAGRDRLPAQKQECVLWSRLLQPGHDLRLAYFGLAGD